MSKKITATSEVLSLHKAQQFLHLRHETVKELLETGQIPDGSSAITGGGSIRRI